MEWSEQDLGAIPDGEVKTTERNGERVSQGVIQEGEECWEGLQHEWTDPDSRAWTTSIVTHRSPEGVAVSIRLECSLLKPGERLPTAKKPYVVRLLLDRLQGARDGSFTVQDLPHGIAEADVDKAVRIVRGEMRCQLPIVYLSAGRGGRPAVDPRVLAQWLGGMAHVVVEPSRPFSLVLARNVENTNPYAGAIGVFWPESGTEHRFFPREGPEQLQRVVAGHVRRNLTYLQPTSRCTFAFMREAASRRKLEALRESGSSKVEEYVAAFDDELQAKEERNSELSREVDRLRAEVRRLEAGAAGGGPIEGTETEFYPGETLDALLHTLAIGRNQLFAGGRRRHLIEGVLSNHTPSDAQAQFEGEIKAILEGSKNISGKAKRQLEDLGFVVDESGKHLQITLRGDPRYSFVAPKTSSDHRAGKNLASTIIQKLFQ